MGVIVYSYLADLIFGDPRWFPHPVRGIGRLIVFLEGKLGRPSSKAGRRFKGAVLAVIVVGASAGSAYLVIEFLTRITPPLGWAAAVFIAYTTLSVRDLFVHVRAVERQLRRGNIERARYFLSRIVGRDTRRLSSEEVILATVETVAENTCDGIVAPLFYLALGGPAAAAGYKAINTLDSMLGYKNEKYLHLGWFCAKLDDAANFIPARITAALIIFAAFILGKDAPGAFKAMKRDAAKHSSPNSGYPEAAAAGTLGVKLGGPCYYQGRLAPRAYLGEEKRKVKPGLVREAAAVSFTVSLLAVLAARVVQWLV